MAGGSGRRLRVPHFVVIGGGAAGAVSVRQLLRAVAAGRLETNRIVVVDRDPACAAARSPAERIFLEISDWSEWLDAHLDRLGPADHLVPYHFGTAPASGVAGAAGAPRGGLGLERRSHPPPQGSLGTGH